MKKKGETSSRLRGGGGDGTTEPVDHLTDEVYGELRRIARNLMAGERPGHTLQATALVNEAWVRMSRLALEELQDRSHLIALVTIQMRRALLDHARRKSADRRPDSRLRVQLDTWGSSLSDNQGDGTADLIDMCAALDELEQLNERHCRVFELRFFGGQTVKECADYLKVSPRTVKYDWQFAAAWIAERMDIRVHA